jgi:hypothetical protein
MNLTFGHNCPEQLVAIHCLVLDYLTPRSFAGPYTGEKHLGHHDRAHNDRNVLDAPAGAAGADQGGLSATRLVKINGSLGMSLCGTGAFADSVKPRPSGAPINLGSSEAEKTLGNSGILD